MSTRQQAQTLINLFERLWEKKYGREYKGNRHADQWGFRDMIDDLGLKRSKEVIRYYFNLASPDHSRQWLIYNYQVVSTQLDDVNADKELRRKLMEQTKKMIEENGE